MGPAHREDRLGVSLAQPHLDRTVRALERHLDVPVLLHDPDRGEGVDPVVGHHRAGMVLGALHGRRVATASTQVPVVDAALGVAGDDVGRVLRLVDAAVEETVRQDEHRRGEAVTAQVGALPGRLRIPLGDPRSSAAPPHSAALIVLAVRAHGDQRLR